MSHAPEQSFALEPHARFRVHDGEGIFVLQEAGEVLVVNSVGAFVVERITQQASLKETAVAMTQNFDVAIDAALRDATQLVGELVNAGALTPT